MNVIGRTVWGFHLLALGSAGVSDMPFPVSGSPFCIPSLKAGTAACAALYAIIQEILTVFRIT
jgi:hypothetical protein